MDSSSVVPVGPNGAVVLPTFLGAGGPAVATARCNPGTACSWCGRAYGADQVPYGPRTAAANAESHGICIECQTAMEKTMPAETKNPPRFAEGDIVYATRTDFYSGIQRGSLGVVIAIPPGTPRSPYTDPMRRLLAVYWYGGESMGVPVGMVKKLGRVRSAEVRDTTRFSTYAQERAQVVESLREQFEDFVVKNLQKGAIKERYGNPADRVTVKKENGEWVAVVYRGGKRDEASTYYSGGDGADYKADAEATAQDMRRRLAIETRTIGHISLPGVNLRLNGKRGRQRDKWLGQPLDRLAQRLADDLGDARITREDAWRTAQGVAERARVSRADFMRLVDGYMAYRGDRSRYAADNPSLMLVTGINPPSTARIEEAWARFHQKSSFTGTKRNLGEIRGAPPAVFALGTLHAIDFGQGDCSAQGSKPWVCCNPEDQSLWIMSSEPMDVSKLSGKSVRSLTYDPMRSSGKDPAVYKHKFEPKKPSLCPVGNAKSCKAVLLDGGSYRVDDWIYD